ncbi:MAG: replication restart helicase PriA, partial [Armatimonadota bacterium]
MNPEYLDVVVDAEAHVLPQPLTYRVPESMRNEVRLGACVLVPLGWREAVGFVVGIENVQPPAGRQTRDILAVVESEPLLDEVQCRLIRWLAKRWHCGLLDALRCLVPPAVFSHVQRVVRLARPWVEAEAGVKLTMRQREVVRELENAGGSMPYRELQAALRNPGRVVQTLKRAGVVEDTYVVLPPAVRPQTRKALKLPDGADLDALLAEAASEKQAAVLRFLLSAGEPVAKVDLSRALGVSGAVLSSLEKRGLAEKCVVQVRREPFGGTAPAVVRHKLTDDQRAVLAPILAALARGTPERYLIHGVTASGKTEVYLRAMEEAAEAGGGSIFLVPEISLTAQMLGAVKSRFGKSAAVLHSRLSEGERFDEWRRIKQGEVSVVVGARSAVFAPMPNLKLIVMDEEHDASYKQESSPRYCTRDVAAKRAADVGGTLVLGSATPSVETFYWAEKGHLKLLTMRRRIDNRPLPRVELVDLRPTPMSIFSDRLKAAVEDRLSHGQQVILFLNRRGFSTFVLCRDCGYTARCPNCSVALTYHAGTRRLQCHHCDYRRRAPLKCPECSGGRIRYYGLGTERVEEEVRQLFPSARPLRMDRDTTTGKNAHHIILQRFRSRDADILIGTQMVAKGLDFPGVTLVGVVAADTALNLPDFRAAERSFQLMAQVSGRAGRGDDPGEVIVQTFNPEHYSLQAASRHEYTGCYTHEILFRK